MKLFTPFANRVFVKIEQDVVGEGLIIPEEYKRSLEKAVGEVLEVGPDCAYAKPGMRVVLSKYSGIELQIMDESYRVMHEDDIAGELHEQSVSTDETLK